VIDTIIVRVNDANNELHTLLGFTDGSGVNICVKLVHFCWEFLNGLEFQFFYLRICLAEIFQPRKIVDIQSAVSVLQFYGSFFIVYERLSNTITKEDIDQYIQMKEFVLTL
jgi:hypothetical protein